MRINYAEWVLWKLVGDRCETWEIWDLLVGYSGDAYLKVVGWEI